MVRHIKFWYARMHTHYEDFSKGFATQSQNRFHQNGDISQVFSIQVQ